jgi:acetyl-CoA carboxylase biotin carboxyl carrier protein
MRSGKMARLEVASEETGKIWKIEVQVGAEVAEDSVLMIVESMKMEIPIVCEEAGVVAELLIKEGDAVEDGQVVAILESR